jgi:hypothetical protein
MEGNARTWFTPKQKAELWERWKSGQCVADIARDIGGRLPRVRFGPDSVEKVRARPNQKLLAS